MTKTKIDWADKVWNPVTGCTKVSAGCKNCYAERMAKRLTGRCGYPEAPNQFKVTLHPEKLKEPFHWKKPARIFVDSMSDLFHESVPQYFIVQIFAVMAIARQHTFIILTKRPDRMMKLIGDLAFDKEIEAWQEQICYEEGWHPQDFDYPLPNVWLGVSAENQKTADERLTFLEQTPAAIRFISLEPMLGDIQLQGWDGEYQRNHLGHKFTGDRNRRGPIDWVICGCESGPGARPMELDWARSLRDQCWGTGVPFFLKQAMINGKLIKMPNLDGRIWDEYPENHVNL